MPQVFQQQPVPFLVPAVIEQALLQGAALAISLSGGKDSQALLELLAPWFRARGFAGQLFAIHADLGRAEWEQTPAFVQQLADNAGVPLVVVRRAKGDLVARIGERMLAPAGTAAPAAGLLDDFTVLDLEFQPKPQALLELAAIRYVNWQPVGKVVSFVRCREELNPHVARLTGITRADVYNAPEEIEVLRAFFKLGEGSLLVAHNIAADKKQPEDARTRCGAKAPLSNPWLCTLALARSRRSPGAPCGLGELCLDFGIRAGGAHRALRDVEMCFEVLRHFHNERPITELITSTAKPKAGTGQLFATAA